MELEGNPWKFRGKFLNFLCKIGNVRANSEKDEQFYTGKQKRVAEAGPGYFFA